MLSQTVERHVVIEDHVVGDRPAGGTRCLLRDPAAHLILGPARALHHAPYLRVLGAIHHQDAVHALPPVAVCGQQCHGEDHGALACCIGLAACRVANHRVQDRLQAPPGRGVGEGQRAHAIAVHCTIGGGNLGAELAHQRRHGLALRGGQAMGNGVGIDEHRPLTDEHRRDGALAAADAARQSQVQRHQSVGNHSRVSCCPKNIAAMPPPTR